jgi:hypothetical protein
VAGEQDNTIQDGRQPEKRYFFSGGLCLEFFNLKNRASLKGVIHEYKIEEKSMAQIDPGCAKTHN